MKNQTFYFQIYTNFGTYTPEGFKLSPRMQLNLRSSGVTLHHSSMFITSLFSVCFEKPEKFPYNFPETTQIRLSQTKHTLPYSHFKYKEEKTFIRFDVCDTKRSFNVCVKGRHQRRQRGRKEKKKKKRKLETLTKRKKSRYGDTMKDG